jgi:hypothetical protein
LRQRVGPVFAGESLTLAICNLIGEPHHHNARGALMMHLSRANLIEKTGDWCQMASPSSHARSTPIYRWMQTS